MCTSPTSNPSLRRVSTDPEGLSTRLENPRHDRRRQNNPQRNATFSPTSRNAPFRRASTVPGPQVRSRPGLGRRSSSKKKLLSMAVSLGTLGRSDSFTLKAPTATPARTSTDPFNRRLSASCSNLRADCVAASTSSTSLNMMSGLPTFNLADAAAPLADVASSAADILGDIGASLTSDADSGAEGMNIISHALLDFPGAMARATVAAKAAEVAGRLFILGQGMLPGHEMMHDVMAFQVAFLAVSCNALYQTVMPKIKAKNASKFMSPADRKAFRDLFKPAGLSWDQFRETSLNSMEWVTLEAGQVLDNDNAYWLYQGDVEVDGEAALNTGLLGEDHIAKTLGLFNGNLDSKPKQQVAGANGATVLKMKTKELEGLMKHDQGLKSSVTSLLFNNMQAKIEATR